MFRSRDDLGNPGDIVVLGHSHMEALIGRHRSNRPTLAAIEGQQGVFALVDKYPRNSKYWAAASSLGTRRTFVLVFGGNEHNTHFLFRLGSVFDFVPSRETQCEIWTGATLVPETLVEEKFRPALDHLRELILPFIARGQRVVLAGTPPPKGDSEQLKRMLKSEPLLIEKILSTGLTIDQVEFTPPLIRLKLWRLLQNLYEETARRAGAEFIAVPTADVCDAEGFLRREYWYNDMTHANTDYGIVVLRHIVASVRH